MLTIALAPYPGIQLQPRGNRLDVSSHCVSLCSWVNEDCMFILASQPWWCVRPPHEHLPRARVSTNWWALYLRPESLKLIFSFPQSPNVVPKLACTWLASAVSSSPVRVPLRPLRRPVTNFPSLQKLECGSSHSRKVGGIGSVQYVAWSSCEASPASRPSARSLKTNFLVSGRFTGIFAVYLAAFNYLADCYNVYASSAMSGQSLARNLCGAIFPLFTQVPTAPLLPTISLAS